jgi:integrase
MKFYLFNQHSVKTPIYLDVNMRNLRVRISTGISINTNTWDSNKRLVTSKHPTFKLINNKLKSLEAGVNNLIYELKIKEQVMNNEEFKETILSIIKPQEYKRRKQKKDSLEVDFILNLELWYEKKKNLQLINKKTLYNYLRSIVVLKEYCELKKIKLTFEDFKKSFCDEFTSYMIFEKNYKEITVGNIYKNLKFFLREQMADAKIPLKDLSYIKIIKDASEDKVSLTDKEIKLLENYTSDDKYLMITRDLFLFQIFTLQRVSDLQQMDKIKFDIEKEIITIKQKKTQQGIVLPLFKIQKEILLKYNYSLPKLALHKYNKLIKEVCKNAGITDEVVIYTKDKLKVEAETFKKYEKISSHTARRTGITYLSRQNIPLEQIMLLSGHKSLTTLQKYIKLEKLDTINNIRNIIDN